METDFLQQIKHLGFTARIKRLNEKIVASTLEHYSNLDLGIEPNWHVIFLLLKEKEKLTVTEIASALGFSHPAMIKITKKMKAQGYLESHKDPSDGRKTFIQLSKKGKKALPAFEKEWSRIQEVLQEFVSDAFLENLNQLEQNFDALGFKERYQKRFGQKAYTIRNARPQDFKEIGKLMVDVYSGLEGFPKADEQPQYYQTLANIGDFTQKPEVELLMAISHDNKILGAVLYFGDLKQYGAGGTVTQEKNASGFRLLAVNSSARGLGIGRALSVACIEKARKKGHAQVIIHSTAYMKVAWKMYEKLGFVPSTDLNFKQEDLQVYGFRLPLY
ncbi:bifunctional helix-turn-helix transcriptional regulator/GNAT family N-acetyltransferase [Muricauda sp. CAU 1633]|uniref:bifunctional helix-turn-helix transcriptional regulator/GNAT family N-acetyltransferase n=1 Tax=Allomuricauda sp. CAU 1633 TaxID=2816036 RepID=UPI001A8D66E4|nr:bifunctional helix-turn-helix transcriptional regulator/GNAT family N-acetyltransferase [Muricauda sp. CAU 1633]MBO0322363.1 bifunctional helix-turn-helix transcriptional regulator/GNAT family N-acetyltransferase [Muricauda sp. CAU 1633]